MTNLYCPNCHRQLHEFDIKIRICTMCNTPFDVDLRMDKEKIKMPKLNETKDLIKGYEDCILHAYEKALFDIAKSLAIIADKLSEVDNKTDKGE